MEPVSYCLYSDESHITASRFESITTISLPSEFEKRLQEQIRDKLQESDVDEVKWTSVDSAKYRFACIKIFDIVIKNLENDIRVDTIVWDNADSRHNIRRRDNAANLGRMYYHLLKFVLERRNPGYFYYLKPDEQVEIDWVSLQKCLSAVGNWEEIFHSELFKIFQVVPKFHIINLTQVHSCDEPICQACDLFAGMAIFSIQAYDKYLYYRKHKNGQLTFIAEERPAYSRGEEEKIICLDYFIEKCKLGRLGVDIDKRKRLWTSYRLNPINFWHYAPQSEQDKAPIKKK